MYAARWTLKVEQNMHNGFAWYESEPILKHVFEVGPAQIFTSFGSYGKTFQVMVGSEPASFGTAVRWLKTSPNGAERASLFYTF